MFYIPALSKLIHVHAEIHSTWCRMMIFIYLSMRLSWYKQLFFHILRQFTFLYREQIQEIRNWCNQKNYTLFGKSIIIYVTTHVFTGILKQKYVHKYCIFASLIIMLAKCGQCPIIYYTIYSSFPKLIKLFNNSVPNRILMQSDVHVIIIIACK